MEGGHHAASGFSRLALLFGLLIRMRMFGMFQEKKEHNQPSFPWRGSADIFAVGTAENPQRNIHIRVEAGVMFQRVQRHGRILHLLPEAVWEAKCLL